MALRASVALVLLSSVGMGLALAGDTRVPLDKQGYLGRWHGPGTLLEIEFDGRVRYTQIHADRHRRVAGTIRVFDGDDFIVGWPWWGLRFHVSQPPVLSNGRWRIVVNDVELERLDDLERVIEI